MEVLGSESHKTVGLFARLWWWIMGFLVKFKAKVMGIVKTTKKIGKDDPRRIIHSIKMGLALSLISLVYYFTPIYDSFGVATMWAVLTVVVVFEFTVGATLGKGLNRGIATFVAGALGVGAHELASFAGKLGEPLVLGLFVFLLAAAASFSRFIPNIKARYDYGVLIFILTFSMVSVSGYRVEKLIELAHKRLSTILIGSLTCVFISIFVCPVWAGEELHNQIAANMEKIAEFLLGFGEEYFQKEDIIGGTQDKKLSLETYKSVLNSKATEESMANFARWEPRHGRFKFRHPWKQYLKIGGLTRQCAYHVEALSSYINSDIQAPPEFKKEIEEASIKMSSESAKTLSELALAIQTTTYPYSADVHVANAKASANILKITLKGALPLNTDLLQITQAVTVTSLLVEIVSCTEKITEAVRELAQLAKFKYLEEPVMVLAENQKMRSRVTIKPVTGMHCPQVVVTIEEPSSTLAQTANLSRAI